MSRKVTITYFTSIETDTVICTGFFDGWKADKKMTLLSLCTETNQKIFEMNISICTDDKKLIVKFIVDGHWLLSPSYPTIFSGPFENNLIDIEAIAECERLDFADGKQENKVNKEAKNGLSKINKPLNEIPIHDSVVSIEAEFIERSSVCTDCSIVNEKGKKNSTGKKKGANKTNRKGRSNRNRKRRHFKKRQGTNGKKPHTKENKGKKN